MPIALFTLFVIASSAQARDAKSLQPSAPEVVATVDAGKLKGEPTQLAWSPDGSKFFLQTSERDSQAMVKNPRYFLLAPGDAKPESIAAVPDWAADYWRWKADKTAPASKTFTIDITREERTGTATAAPMGGSLARGGANGDPSAGTTVEDVTTRALQMQKQQVITLTLKNEVVGEFVNQQFLPGYTFGWSPQSAALSTSMIAYRTRSGRLGIMDETGQKQEIGDTRDVLLPAWSADGSKIAFFQRTGKTKYNLVVVRVK
jgi:hypothetical protein